MASPRRPERYRNKATGAILRAEADGRKVAVFYDYPEHCGQPSWMSKAEFKAQFERVNPSPLADRRLKRMSRFRQVKCTRCGKRGDALHKVQHDVWCLKETLAAHEAVASLYREQFGRDQDLSLLRAEIARRSAEDAPDEPRRASDTNYSFFDR